PEFVATYGQTWKTLGSALGEARNWDVFLEETLPPFMTAFPDDKDGKHLHKTAIRKSSSARKTVTKLLALKEYPCLLLEFTAAVYTVGETRVIPLSEFGNQQIARYSRNACRLARRGATLTPSERHKMRISFKKLRYSLEFFLPLLEPRQSCTYLYTLTRIQDDLGRINDHSNALLLVTSKTNGRPSSIVSWISGRHQLLVFHLQENLQIWSLQKLPKALNFR
ncbi:MAG: hypothetical protein C0508_25670, partial [Cyanobacteria bacterium PR.023]|nr:hypothetical protein [Cyanobacteria bacterium PR.023]